MSRPKEGRKSSIRELKPAKPAAGEGSDVAAEHAESLAGEPAGPAEPLEDVDAPGEGALESPDSGASEGSRDGNGIEEDNTEAFLEGLVEALLFSSDRPMPAKEIARAAGVDRRRAEELVAGLRRRHENGGLCIEEVAGGFVMRSSPRYAVYIQKLLALRPVRLSRAQLETLAIIAYRQPVTKPEVDDIRGVDSGQVLKGLLERDLLKILGKKDEPGRPMLYGTTTGFLELLNLQSLKDLPTLREYTELSEESRRKFADETGDETMAATPGADAQPDPAEPAGDASADFGAAEAEPAGEPSGEATSGEATSDEDPSDEDPTDEDTDDEDTDDEDTDDEDTDDEDSAPRP